MALTVEIYRLSSWQAITQDIPFFGDPVPGLVPFELEMTRESNVAVLRFAVNASSYSEEALGTEIRVRIDGTQIFGGYLTTRERIREGVIVGANYECQDYNSIMDRIVVTGYTIDAGDTDSTEIETLRASKLNAIGVTAGTINTVQASMPELYLQGTFREAMEQIAAAAGGAHFYIDQDKALNYVAATSDLTTVSPETLDDDRTVADSYPYADFTEREDETRKINRVFVIGDGIDGWYPAADSGETYQTIIYDNTVTSQDALDAVGAAIVDDWGSSLKEYSLRCWEDAFFDGERVEVTHSDFISGGETLFVRRVVMRARSSDCEEREYILELGDHTVDSDRFGGSAPGSDGDRGPIFGDGSTTDTIECDDALGAGSERYAAREDHQHAIVCEAPTGTLTEATANAEGTAVSFARSDHTHDIDVSATRAPHDAQYVVLAVDGELSAERVLTGGDGISLTDAGANDAATLAVDLVAAWSGLEFNSGELQIDQDATYTWTAVHTHTANIVMDDGTSHSPQVQFIGGTNDDTAYIFLVDDADANQSDLAATLCDDAGESAFAVRNASGAYVFGLRSDGCVLMNLDDTWFGRGAGSVRLVFDNTDTRIEMTAGDFEIATAGRGIIHTDGVTDGQVLVADGTRYIPGTLSDITGGDAQYVTLAATGDLANERVLTSGDGLAALADGGAGNAITVAMGTPSTLTVATSNGLTATSHTHEITSSADPGAAASLLATDSDGYVEVVSLGIGATPAAANCIRVVDDAWIGIGAGGRITFDNQATDQIEITDAVLIVNDSTLDGNQSGNVAEVHDGHLGISGADGETAIAQIFAYGADATDDIGIVRIRKARGTQASPAAVQSGDSLGRLGAGGYGASAYSADSTGRLQIVATQNWTDAAHGTRLDFWTTPNGSTTPAQVGRFSQAGYFKAGYAGTPDTPLHGEQHSTTGNVPVLKLVQEDVDKEFFALEGDAASGEVTYNLVDEGDQGGQTLRGWFKIRITDNGNEIDDTVYHVPFYELTAP